MNWWPTKRLPTTISRRKTINSNHEIPLLRDPEAQADAANTTGRAVAKSSRAAFAGAVLPSTAGCGRSDESGLNRRAVGAYSRDVRIPTAFVARKGNPGFGRAVDVLWPMARRTRE